MRERGQEGSELHTEPSLRIQERIWVRFAAFNFRKAASARNCLQAEEIINMGIVQHG